REDGVSVHRALHSGAGDVEIRTSVDEDESEAFRAHRDAARDLVRELDRGVFLAADPRDDSAAFEGIEKVAVRILVRVGDLDVPGELIEREDPGSLLAELIEDLGI